MAQALEDLLDRTRDALVAGDLAALAALAPRVEALTDSLAKLDARDAQRLHRKASRNALLLQAAARGVRAAQGRFGEIVAGPTLTTYDSRGRKEAIAPLSALAPKRF